jgi:hypothetical protein
MTISKHKSESSLKHYVSKAREKKKREMSNALAEQVLPQEDPEHNVDTSPSTETAVESKLTKKHWIEVCNVLTFYQKNPNYCLCRNLKLNTC